MLKSVEATADVAFSADSRKRQLRRLEASLCI